MSLVLYKKNFKKNFPELFDSIFDDFFNPTIGKGFYLDKNTPSANIFEDDKTYKIELASPGMNKNDFRIELEDNSVSISFENKKELSKNEDGYLKREFYSNSFNRSFILPENVDENSAKADYKDGILTLEFSKVKEISKAPKLIEVN